jgi:hypothetical protein
MTVGCAVHPIRIDFTITPLNPSLESGGRPFMLIEDTPELHAELTRVIESVGREAATYTVCRVGVYLHFITITPTIEEANRVLHTVIPEPYRAPIVHEEDFILQINRPRASTEIPGIKINYITKWSMDRFQVFNLSIPVGTAVADSRIAPSSQAQEYLAASVTIDNNNTPVVFSLSSQQQASLLRETLIQAELMQEELGLKVEGF